MKRHSISYRCQKIEILLVHVRERERNDTTCHSLGYDADYDMVQHKDNYKVSTMHTLF